MGKRVKIQTNYSAEALHERYRQAKDAVERTHWHMLWLAKEGKTPQVIAEQLGYTARWVRTVIGRWNAQGAAGIRDRRHEIDVSRPLLSPERDRGTGSSFASQASRRRTVEWSKSGPVAPQRGWDYLQRLGH